MRIVRPFLRPHRLRRAGSSASPTAAVVSRARWWTCAFPAGWAQLQVLEYLRAFLFGRMGWDALDATLVISGAFGIFKREYVVPAGGYATDTVGEDMELVVRLHRHCAEANIPYRIHFVPDPVAWTEVPETLRSLSASAIAGSAACRVAHAPPRHAQQPLRQVGMLAFPYFFFLEMLGPLIEASATSASSPPGFGAGEPAVLHRVHDGGRAPRRVPLGGGRGPGGALVPPLPPERDRFSSSASRAGELRLSPAHRRLAPQGLSGPHAPQALVGRDDAPRLPDRAAPRKTGTPR